MIAARFLIDFHSLASRPLTSDRGRKQTVVPVRHFVLPVVNPLENLGPYRPRARRDTFGGVISRL